MIALPFPLKFALHSWKKYDYNSFPNNCKKNLYIVISQFLVIWLARTLEGQIAEQRSLWRYNWKSVQERKRIMKISKARHCEKKVIKKDGEKDSLQTWQIVCLVFQQVDSKAFFCASTKKK